MSQTEDNPAEVFFANVVVPLHNANLRRHVSYFPHGSEASRESYWKPLTSRLNGQAELTAADSDADGMLRQLTAYWTGRSEPLLAKILPDLQALQQDLMKTPVAAAQRDGKLSDYVYPLY